MEVIVTDGTLTIGIRNQGYQSNSWTAFRDFKLTYYGGWELKEGHLTIWEDYDFIDTKTTDSQWLYPWRSLGDQITTIEFKEGVTVIGQGAFGSNFTYNNIKNVTIPEGVTRIGNSAFYFCRSLTNVTLPSSLTYIGNDAFMQCGTDFTAITIPDNVTYLGQYAFHGCENLSSVVLPEGITQIGMNTFYGCINLKSITIPNNVSSIGESAFSSCYNLESVILGDRLTEINNYAFVGCSNLKTITIPASVTEIGAYAFNATGIKEITSLATTAPTLGEEAFSCISFEATLNYPEGSDYSSWMKYFEDDIYYLKNVSSGTFLQAGSYWGTSATLGEHGLNVKINELPNGKYSIATNVSNGGTNYYLGIVNDGSIYLDTPISEWTIQQQANGYYTFTLDGSNYMGYNGSDEVSFTLTDASQPNAQWQLITKEERIATMTNIGTPTDATFLLPGATFNRNDIRNSSWTDGPGIKGYSNSSEANFCAEKFDTDAFDVYQEINVPNGYYRITAQGFYRMSNDITTAIEHHIAGTETLNAILYANQESTPLMSIFDEAQVEPFSYGSSYETALGYVPNEWESAAAAFTAGLYEHSLLVHVTDGTLRIGIKKETGNTGDWVSFDNFHLTYYGTELTADAADDINFKLLYAELLIKNNPQVIGEVLVTLQAEIAAANNIENLDKAIKAFEAVIPIYKELQALVQEYEENSRVATEITAGKAVLAEKGASTESVQTALDALKLAISTLYELEIGDVVTYTNAAGVEKHYRVLGTNMIENASFHNGTEGWTGGAGGTLADAGWHAEGGMDGGAYICPTVNDGKGSNNSIGAAWAIEKGKSYVFSYYIRHTTPEAVAKEGYIVTSETNTPRGDESKVLMYAHTDADNAWTQNLVVTTAEYNHLQFCARWLGGRQDFDGFYLAEVEEIPDPKELLALVEECEDWLAHYDNPEGVAALEAKIDEAEALVAGDAYNAHSLNAMTASLKDALLNFRIANASVENPVDVSARYGKNLDFESSFFSWKTENELTSGGANIRFLSYFGENTRVCEINGKPVAETSIRQTIAGLPKGYYKLYVQAVMNHTVEKGALSGAVMSYNGTELDLVTDSMTIVDATAEEAHPQTFVIESFVTADSVELALSVQANANFTYLAIDNIVIEYLGKYIELGDVNNDFNHTMNDVVMTVNAVLEKPSMKFNQYAADVNDDDIIAMGDVVNILQMVLTEGAKTASYGRNRTAAYDSKLIFTTTEATVATGIDCVVPIALSNTGTYSAFQVDVELPVGVELIDIQLSNRAQGTHTVAWNTLSNGMTRVVAYAADNAAFAGNEGNLINFVVKADATLASDAAMTLAKGMFVTVAGAEHTIANASISLRAKTTEIRNVGTSSLSVYGTTKAIVIETSEMTVVDIFAIDGKLVQSVSLTAGKSLISVPAGIYVVNNSKVTVK